MKICFNHNYYLRHDSERTILSTNPFALDDNVKQGWLSRIHPLYAMMFALISVPTDIEQAISRIADFFSISSNEAEDILFPFLKEKGVIKAVYQGTTSIFPPKVILKDTTDKFMVSGHYSPSQFVYTSLDLDSFRMKFAPQGIVLIINNHCVTNCVYCYADKNHECNESPNLETIDKLLQDAHKLGIREFQIIGGEFFLYKEWEKLLVLFQKYHFYQPLISTKVPLSKKQIDAFKKFGIRLQISFDACDSLLLQRTLNVSESYFEKMKSAILMVDKAGINFQIATVLTKHTASLNNLNNLYSFLRNLKHLRRWEIRFAFRSLYTNVDFDNIKVSTVFEDVLSKWYNEVVDSSPINIVVAPKDDAKYFSAKNGSPSFEGPRCSANSTHMVILPDGQVTICEQLYWNPRFIIGNIYKNTIHEIWTSNRALELAKWQQKDIQTKSPCSICELYEKCLNYPNKCFANTLKAYGDENWDFPDPRCDRALAFINPL